MWLIYFSVIQSLILFHLFANFFFSCLVLLSILGLLTAFFCTSISICWYSTSTCIFFNLKLLLCPKMLCRSTGGCCYKSLNKNWPSGDCGIIHIFFRFSKSFLCFKCPDSCNINKTVWFRVDLGEFNVPCSTAKFR